MTLVAILFSNCGTSSSGPSSRACGGLLSSGALSLSFSPEGNWLTAAQNTAWGFQYGSVDGTLGALALGNGGFKFFMAAAPIGSSTGTLCGPTGSNGTYGGIEGSYTMNGTLSAVNPSGSNASNCTPVITKGSFGGVPSGTEPNGYVFDRDYGGGGPVNITDGTTSGVLHVYHGEYHSGANFYAALGMAVSTDGGNTFQKLGEIIQPYLTQTQIFEFPQTVKILSGGDDRRRMPMETPFQLRQSRGALKRIFTFFILTMIT